MVEDKIARRLIKACAENPKLREVCLPLLGKIASPQNPLPKITKVSSDHAEIEKLKRIVKSNPRDEAAREQLFRLTQRKGVFDLSFWMGVGLIPWVMNKLEKPREIQKLIELRKKNNLERDLEEKFLSDAKQGRGWRKEPREVEPIDGEVYGGEFWISFRPSERDRPSLALRINENLEYQRSSTAARELDKWKVVSYQGRIKAPNAELYEGQFNSLRKAMETLLSELRWILNKRNEARRAEEQKLLKYIEKL